MFSPSSLDGICAFSLRHLVEDRAAALARVSSLLKPGGFFISSTLVLAESWLPYGVLISVMRAFGKAPRVSMLRAQTVADEVRRAGFVSLEQPDVGAARTVAFIVATKPG